MLPSKLNKSPSKKPDSLRPENDKNGNQVPDDLERDLFLILLAQYLRTILVAIALYLLWHIATQIK